MAFLLISPVISELKLDAEILLPQALDDRLQIIPIFPGDPHPVFHYLSLGFSLQELNGGNDFLAFLLADAALNGYLLADGSKKINLTAPAVYAIKANAAGRLFDQSADPIPVAFTIQTLGGGSVKATLQQKYAMGYLDMEGQVDQPVAIAGEKATLYLPGETPKGTYRFVLTLWNPGDTLRARDVENIIIK